MLGWGGWGAYCYYRGGGCPWVRRKLRKEGGRDGFAGLLELRWESGAAGEGGPIDLLETGGIDRPAFVSLGLWSYFYREGRDVLGSMG